MIRYLALALLLAAPAFAQGQPCGPRPLVVEHLATKYGESVQSIGMAANGLVAEVWANVQTGTWTFTVTQPDGMICLVASGTSFEHAPQAPEPMGEDG